MVVRAVPQNPELGLEFQLRHLLTEGHFVLGLCGSAREGQRGGIRDPQRKAVATWGRR